MSTENTAQSLGAAFAFTAVAWLADFISVGLNSLQVSVFSALFLGPQALITGAVALILAVIDFIFSTDIFVHVTGGFVVFLSLQALVSLLTLCVFYAIVLSSPKGTYTLLDCLIAAGICLLEAAPFVSSFVFWGTFAAYLRRREISGAIGKVSSAAGLDTATGSGKGGGVGGMLKKVLRK